MDTEWLSSVAVAENLGVSVPIIHRAIARLPLEPCRGPKGHLRVTQHEAQILLEDLGKAPKGTGFTREELFVLHVLQRRPFGLRSGRAVAKLAGISPSTASQALGNLEKQGLVEHRRITGR